MTEANTELTMEGHAFPVSTPIKDVLPSYNREKVRNAKGSNLINYDLPILKNLSYLQMALGNEEEMNVVKLGKER